MLIGGSATVATLAWAVALAWSAALVWWDLRHRRLPDALTLPAAVVALGACVARPDGWWGIVWPILYLAAGRGIGGGDIKLALPLGVAAALGPGPGTGPLPVLLAAGAASLLTLAYAVLTRAPGAPHGPSMIGAAWLCLLMGSFPAQL